MLPESRLSVEGLAQRFGRRALFRGIAFDLGPGDSLAITGPNGAGKSTLLQIVAGARAPTAGTVRLWLKGAEVAPEARPLRTGFVAPYLNLYDAFTGRENLRFLARARRLADADAHVTDVLDRVGLGSRGDDLVRTYSSGMKQRIRLGAALLASPSLLLLDEPTSNLDAPGRAMVEAAARAHCAAGGILLVATNVEYEAAWCDHALVIDAG